MRVESALSPICATPILPNILPFCAHYQGIKLAEAPLADFQQLIAIQSGLQTVVEKQGDLSLSHTIRKSEVAVRDLTARIRFSQLDSKDALVGQLESFSAGAQDAAEGLESLASRVGGSLDIIISMDEFALKRLERIERDGIAFGSQMFNMMALRSTESMRLRQRQELASSFERALAFTGKQLKQLVSDATVVLNVLRRLDKIQNTVHEIITEENNTIKNEGEELLAQLWTILGGNRAEVALFKENRDLLAKLFRFHNAARDQVVNTIGQLRMLSGALSELRDRVALPVDHGADGLIPFEVHLESLRRGVEKLEVFRIQTNDRENQQLRHMLIEPLPESQQIGSA
ncbi:hypothetical protein DL93DRAFT_1945353 [Clavulina sp. PMI_390]|nr:hypothetical protein DL93DRAFT_1945353 [Clavulina sp. PMI_390]